MLLEHDLVLSFSMWLDNYSYTIKCKLKIPTGFCIEFDELSRNVKYGRVETKNIQKILKIKTTGGLPWWSSGQDSILPM